MMATLVAQTPILPSELPVLLWVLLGLILFFQVTGVLSRWLLGRRLKRIEARLNLRKTPAGKAERQPGGQAGGKHFEQFLAADPRRRELPKKEQFAAFRKWRQEMGLTWDK